MLVQIVWNSHINLDCTKFLCKLRLYKILRFKKFLCKLTMYEIHMEAKIWSNSHVSLIGWNSHELLLYVKYRNLVICLYTWCHKVLIK